MAGDQSRVFRLDPVEHLFPDLGGHFLVHVKRHGPVGLRDLGRMAGHVAQNQCPLPSRHDGQTHVAWGMAWARDGRDFARQRAFTREKIEDTERLERPQGFVPKGEGRLGLDFGLLEGRPVGFMHDIAGAGERGARVVSTLTQVPADMVWMQVREEDGVHLLGTDTGVVQFGHEPSIDASPKLLDRAGAGGVAPEAGIHEDGTSLRAQEITPVMVVPGIRATEQLWVALPERFPGVRRDGGKELTQRHGEIAGVIGEGQHLDIANEQFVFRHGSYLLVRVSNRINDCGVC